MRALTIFHDANLAKSAEWATERISIAELFREKSAFRRGSFQRLISNSPGRILWP